jgi:hypothetical protein
MQKPEKAALEGADRWVSVIETVHGSQVTVSSLQVECVHGKNPQKLLQPMHQSLLVSVVRNENEMNQNQVAECDVAQKLCSCRHVIAYHI